MKKFKRKPHFIQYLLAGLAVTATAGTVFAADRFVMDKQQVPTGETEIAAMVSQLPTGETEEDDIIFEDVAMTFSFSSDHIPNEVWVKPDYLPDIPEDLNPDFMVEGDPGWYQYLSGEYGFTDPIPWQISVIHARDDTKLLLFGTLESEEEDTWDGLQVTEVAISIDGRHENYVILFDPENGYMITVAGTMEFDELEKIAKGLEIRVTDDPVSMSALEKGASMLNIGRG